MILFALYGSSGFLLVSGNYKEFQVFYNWLIVTAHIIVLMFGYIVFARLLRDHPLWQGTLICAGTLVSSFITVLLHVLVCKDIVRNRWIRTILGAIIVPSGSVRNDRNKIYS
ncbi:uncharacterized protein LOC113565249 [Drosophila persimilis]|nr:uncharacterized protein LOC113565249 [Drosophila persimilis]